MAKQALSVRSTNVTVGNAAAELRTNATEGIFVTEVDIFMAGPAGGTFGIGFPAAIGITPTSPVTLISESGLAQTVGNVYGDKTPTASVALAWGTGPTVPAAFLRRVTLAASTGAFASVNFPEGLFVPVSSSLVVWNIGTTDVADITFVVTRKPISGGRMVTA